MNVLPIVFSILMLLAIMTYGQLQTFLMRSAIRLEYTCYLENRSRNNLNCLQEHLYESNHTEKEKKENHSERSVASRLISIQWFLNEPQNDQDWSILQANNEIIRRLFDNLYSDRQFYREAEERRPDIVNELWTAVIDELKEKNSRGETLTKKEHIENLPLADPELSLFLSHLLKYDETPESIRLECGDKEVMCVKKTVVYYPNILDFISIKKVSSKQYRVFLMEKPLLMAIFQDEGVVDEIIKERWDHYRDLDKTDEDQRAARKQDLEIKFEETFKNKIPTDIPEGIINFQISLSRPPK
jgi:hypothetical protein